LSQIKIVLGLYPTLHYLCCGLSLFNYLFNPQLQMIPQMLLAQQWEGTPHLSGQERLG
jgi:hypothetical protein